MIAERDTAASRDLLAGTRVLEVSELKTHFATDEGVVRAVDGVSFHLEAGEVLAIVGESGSGKTVGALSVLGLVPGTGRVQEGSVRLGERELLGLPAAEMQTVRGREVAMIFQDALTALNPVYSVGEQLVETLRVHEPQPWDRRAAVLRFSGRVLAGLTVFLAVAAVMASSIGTPEVVMPWLAVPPMTVGSWTLAGGTAVRLGLWAALALAWFATAWATSEARIDHDRSYRARAVELLCQVGIPEPDRRFDEFPHQLSGGMRQRAMIAMALSCRPRVLIADEPTTALDVTIQAQILALMNGLRHDYESGIILITHDLGVVAEMADRVLVMYGGRKIEYAPVHDLFARTMHPYTWGLLRSLPRLDAGRPERLVPIQGVPPSLIDLPEGCHFHPRCAFARDRCRSEYPQLREVAPGHLSACHFAESFADGEKTAAGDEGPAERERA